MNIDKAEEIELQQDAAEAEDAPELDQDQDTVPDAGQEPAADELPDEVVITIDGVEPEPEPVSKAAPEWLRELRRANKEDKKRIRELEEKLNAVAPKEDPVTIGAKPTLEGCEYDPDVFEVQLEAWHARKRQAAEMQAEAERQVQAQQAEWQKRIDNYAKAKSELKVRDYDDAEQVAFSSLNETQQGIILQGSDSPAAIVYALGKNPKKAAEIAAIKDPIKYAFAIAKLEANMKITSRKAPAPEKPISSGGGRISGSVDSELDRLRATAEKTGDMTPVIRYKAEQRKKAK
jgi:hypothetical protein